MNNPPENATPAGAPPASEVGDDVITVADLRTECDQLLRAVVAEGGARVDAESERPGGVVNPATDARAWLRHLRHLTRLHANRAGRQDDVRSPADARLAGAIETSLAEEPVAVPFSDGTLRHVYPKSYHALRWLDSLDVVFREHARAAAALAEIDGPIAEELRAIALAPLTESLAVRTWLWVLTTKGVDDQGKECAAALPFADEAVTVATPPEWTKTVTPEDILRVFPAHVQVHQERLHILSHAFPSDPASSSRLTLAGFIGAMAHEPGRPDARTLMRYHSVGKLFSQAIVAAESHREARRRAKESRESEGA